MFAGYVIVVVYTVGAVLRGQPDIIVAQFFSIKTNTLKIFFNVIQWDKKGMEKLFVNHNTRK